MKKSVVLSVFIMIALVFNIKAQEGSTINPEFIEKVSTWMVENKVPVVAISIIEKGKLRFISVLGDRKKNVPVSANTVFNIASLIKPVIAILTLKLVESGQWSLDEPIGKYWVDPDLSKEPVIKKLTTRLILGNQYSEAGYQYLKKAMENTFHKSLAELSDSILFKPLGMKNTTYTLTETIKNTRFVFGHDDKGNMYREQDLSNSNAPDNLFTSIEDISKFLIYVMKGAGLSKVVFDEMVRPQVIVKENTARGLGWTIVYDLPNEEYALEQDGSTPGFKAMTIMLPKSKTAIVVFTNGDNGDAVYDNIISESSEWGQRVLDITSGANITPIIHLKKELLDSYLGTYVRSDIPGSLITIIREGTDLSISGDGMPSGKLLVKAENKFFLEGYDYQYEFVRDENYTETILYITKNGKLVLFAKKKR